MADMEDGDDIIFSPYRVWFRKYDIDDSNTELLRWKLSKSPRSDLTTEEREEDDRDQQEDYEELRAACRLAFERFEAVID